MSHRTHSESPKSCATPDGVLDNGIAPIANVHLAALFHLLCNSLGPGATLSMSMASEHSGEYKGWLDSTHRSNHEPPSVSKGRRRCCKGESGGGKGEEELNAWSRTQRLSGGNLFRVFRCDGGFGRCPPSQAVHPLPTLHGAIPLPPPPIYATPLQSGHTANQAIYPAVRCGAFPVASAADVRWQYFGPGENHA